MTPDAEPERLAAALRAQGARLVSLNPLRATLEDFFIEQVTSRQANPPLAGAWRRTDRARHRPGGLPRVQGVGPGQGAVQPRPVCRRDDLRVVPDRPAHGRQDVKIIKDLGLAASSVFGLFIAVFIGVGLVWKEVDRRSVYALLVKPIRREAFIVGKFLGLALTLAVNLAVMMAALYAVLAFMA